MKISELKPLEQNPFKLKGDEQLEKIANSIESFKKMMSIRKIIIDENQEIIGGNKRYFALKKLGYKQIPDEWIDKRTDLSEAEKREFIVKDNSHFGSEWDTELLTEWNVPVEEWGVDLPDIIDNSDSGDVVSDFDIKQSIQVLPKNEYIIIVAKDGSDEWDELKSIFKCETVRSGGCKIGSNSDKVGTGTERVFDLKTFKKRLGL